MPNKAENLHWFLDICRCVFNNIRIVKNLWN